MNETACKNTDRIIFQRPSRFGELYEDANIHVTEQGAIGIRLNGLVFVKTLEQWHRLAGTTWQLRDKCGRPVERIKGRPITNFLRLILHTNWRKTWRQRHDYRPNVRPR